jgi:PKD repeat protein
LFGTRCKRVTVKVILVFLFNSNIKQNDKFVSSNSKIFNMKNNLLILSIVSFTFLFTTSCSKEEVTSNFSYNGATKFAYAPTSINFKNLSLKGEEYLWDFGDGTTSDQENPIHEFKEEGVYQVSLLVKDKKDRPSLTNKTITILPQPT